VNVAVGDVVGRVADSVPLEVASDWSGVDFDLAVVQIVLVDPSVPVARIGLWQVESDTLETVDWDLVSVFDLPAVAAIVAVAVDAIVVVVAAVAVEPIVMFAD
jgi:hypothetical protein